MMNPIHTKTCILCIINLKLETCQISFVEDWVSLHIVNNDMMKYFVIEFKMPREIIFSYIL
jgi:hypothetical protein